MGWAFALHVAILSPVLHVEQAGVHLVGVPGVRHRGVVALGDGLGCGGRAGRVGVPRAVLVQGRVPAALSAVLRREQAGVHLPGVPCIPHWGAAAGRNGLLKNARAEFARAVRVLRF